MWILSQRQKNLASLQVGSRNGRMRVVMRLRGTQRSKALWRGVLGMAAELETQQWLWPHHVCTAQGVLTASQGFTPCPQSPD